MPQIKVNELTFFEYFPYQVEHDKIFVDELMHNIIKL